MTANQIRVRAFLTAGADRNELAMTEAGRQELSWQERCRNLRPRNRAGEEKVEELSKRIAESEEKKERNVVLLTVGLTFLLVTLAVLQSLLRGGKKEDPKMKLSCSYEKA